MVNETRDYRYSIDWCGCIHGLHVLVVAGCFFSSSVLDSLTHSAYNSPKVKALLKISIGSECPYFMDSYIKKNIKK